MGTSGPGDVRLVTCRKTFVSGRVVTRCKTRVLGVRVTLRTGDRGALVRNGIVYAHGKVRHGLLVLHAPRGVPRGRYHLIIRGHNRTIRRTVRIT